MTTIKPSPRGWQAWGDAFYHYLDVKGYDHGYAAYMADGWRKRREKASMKQKDPHAVALGRKGGQATSPAKTAAARENAKKGGWPKGKKRKPER